MKKKSLFNSFIVLSLCVLCVGTVVATTLFRPIRASINNNYTYTLNGKAVLKGQPAILYKGKFYGPIAELSNALGYNVTIQEDMTTLTTPSPSKPSKDTVTLNQAIITAIDFASNRITVYPKGQANTAENQIDLLVTPETTITDANGNYQYNITNLTTNMLVKVVYSAKMTKSIPPQANAISIQILNGSTPIQPR